MQYKLLEFLCLDRYKGSLLKNCDVHTSTSTSIGFVADDGKLANGAMCVNVSNIPGSMPILATCKLSSISLNVYFPD